MNKQQLCEGCDSPIDRSDQYCTHCGRARSAVGTPTIHLQQPPPTQPVEHTAPEKHIWLWLVCSVGLVLFTGMLLLYGVAGQDKAPVPTTSIDVLANQGWQQSDMILRQGERFRIEYVSGKWTYWENTIAPHGGDGGSYRCSGAACCEPLPQAHKGALIGKIGQEVLLVGHGGSFTASASAPLFLRINDCDGSLADNTGSVNIRITHLQ